MEPKPLLIIAEDIGRLRAEIVSLEESLAVLSGAGDVFTRMHVRNEHTATTLFLPEGHVIRQELAKSISKEAIRLRVELEKLINEDARYA